MWWGNRHGFIGNRMLEPHATEARPDAEGALPYQVDRAPGVRFRHGAVPHVRRGRYRPGVARPRVGWGRPDQPVVQVDNRLCEMGCLARRAVPASPLRAGSRQAEHDTEVDALVSGCRDRWATRGAISPTRKSSSVACWRWSTRARRSSTRVSPPVVPTSTVYLNGYGFPRGGRSHGLGRSLGAAELLQRLRFLDSATRALKPASLVERLAAEGGAFADLQEVR